MMLGVQSNIASDSNSEEQEYLLQDNNMGRLSSVEFDDEITHIGVGLAQYLVVLTMGIGNMADAVEVFCVSFVVSELESSQDMSITDYQKAFLQGSVFIGMLIGGFLAGILADKFGRRPYYLLSMGINAIFAGVSAIAPSTWWLIVFRTLSGVGVGASIPVTFTMVTEFLPPNHRGQFISYVAAFWTIGCLSAAGFTTCFMTLAFVWESPRYLLSVGRFEDATAVMTGIAKRNRSHTRLGPNLRLRAAHVVDNGENGEKGTNGDRNRLLQLVSPSLFLPFMLLLVIWVGCSFGWYGLLLWIPEIFKKSDFHLNEYETTFIVQVANIPGVLFATFTVDRFGRKKIMMGSLLASALSAILFAFANTPFLTVFAASLFNMVSVASWTTLDCLSSESFPTSLRGTAMGVLAGSGRIASFGAQFANTYMIDVSQTLLLLVTSASMGMGAVASFFLKETGGKKLSDTI